VFTSLVQDAKRAANDKFKLAGMGALIGVLVAVALSFFTLAAFVWVEEEYGTVTAGVALGLFFLVLASLMFFIAWFRRRRSVSQRKELAGQGLQQVSPAADDPVVIAMGTEILRLMGSRNILPALALSAVVLAVWRAIPRTKSRAEQLK
jgi:hypothetical protein